MAFFSRACRHRARYLGAVVVALLIGSMAFGSVFDVLPHFKKVNKPICNQYGDCYGYYQPAYRQFPAACSFNPPVQRLDPTRMATPPQPAAETPPETPPEPVSGILYEVLDDPAPITQATISPIRGGEPSVIVPVRGQATPR